MAEDTDIDKAARLIRAGKLVAFPTETVYGLGADALNPLAVAKIFELKQRPAFDPLIVHIADPEQVGQLALVADSRVRLLTDRFWPGPLTLVLPKRPHLPDLVTSGLPTVGLRMPDHPLALRLIRAAGRPLAAPSANPFGRISPTTAAHVAKGLPGVDMILDGGSTSLGIESTIIALTDKGFRLLHQGIITAEQLEELLPQDHAPLSEATLAPGMLKSHYSPRKPMFLVCDGQTPDIDKRQAGLLSFSGKFDAGYARVIRLTAKADLLEYAVGLFRALHELEDGDLPFIVAETVPEQGIGRAIMDRLRKAAYAAKDH